MLVAALTLGVAAVGLQAVLPGGPATEAGVALPDADEVAGTRGPTREEAADALALFDESRVRCQPEGCEGWRRRVAEPWGRVVAFDGQLFAVEDGDIVSIDPSTGEDRWRHRIDGVVHDAGSGEATPWTPAPNEIQILQGGPGLLLHDNRGVWQLRDAATGQVRWTNTLPLRNAWWHEDVDGLLIMAADGRVGDPRVGALDIATGTLRWSRTIEGGNFWEVVGSGIIIERDGMLEVLSPATGEATLTVPSTPESWLESIGPWLVLHEMDSHRSPEHTTRLLDPDDGSVALELPGNLGYPYLHIDGRVIAFLTPDEQPVGPFSVVAVAPDGSIAWEHRFDGQQRRHACCAAITPHRDDAVLVRLPGDGPALALDLGTGEVREDGLAVPDLPEDVWWEDGLGHTWREDGLVLHDGRGAQIRVSGEGWPILSDPVVLISERELVGMRFVTD